MPKKSLGQNFLIDKNIIKKIINLSNIQNRHVIEIGPGNGELTDEIINNKPKSITLIEKDFDLSKRLKKKGNLPFKKPPTTQMLLYVASGRCR